MPVMTGTDDTIDWQCDRAAVPYRAALAEMEERNAAISVGEAREMIWLLEHPPVYTAGTSADPAEMLNPQFDVVETGRGGRYTYHGPGQRIGYVMLDLKKRGRDVRRFVHALEGWVIATLAELGIESWAVDGRVGIWTRDVDGAEADRCHRRSRGVVTMHEVSVNLSPDLSISAVCALRYRYAGRHQSQLGIAMSAEQWDAAHENRARLLAALRETA